jgi:hypothetical protein
MIRAIPAGILREILLVIVGAEIGDPTEATPLHSRVARIGRLSVDVGAVPSVDLCALKLASPPGVESLRADRFSPRFAPSALRRPSAQQLFFRAQTALVCKGDRHARIIPYPLIFLRRQIFATF